MMDYEYEALKKQVDELTKTIEDLSTLLLVHDSKIEGLESDASFLKEVNEVIIERQNSINETVSFNDELIEQISRQL
ncbi:hypothetical protein AALB39_04345 [Lachnospiraceae bacterium 54-53]